MQAQALSLAIVLAASATARAAEPAELISCFSALEGVDEDGRPLTVGRGQDVGRWEWAPGKLYTAIAVPEPRDGREGFYFYGVGSAEFVHFAASRIPDWMKTGAYRRVPLELRPKGAGRGYFHCTYQAVDAKGDIPRLECDFTNKEPQYYEPVVVALKGSEKDWNALKTAAMERIMSSHGVFDKRVERYREGLARWRKRNADPPGWASAMGVAGMNTSWYFAKPDEPARDAAVKALGVCAKIDDNYLGASAKAEIKLIETAIMPQP